jgi:hypothetical protein
MKIPEIPLVGEASRSIQAQPSRTRIVTVFVTFALTIVCILAGAPAATAATAPTVIPSASDRSFHACGGECPGFCPCPSQYADL